MTVSSSMPGGLLENRAAVLGCRDVVPVEVELQQDLLGVLSMFWCTRGRWWGFVELDWCGHDLVLVALVVDVRYNVSVRPDLWVVQRFLRRRQRRPHTGFVGEHLAPVVQ